MFKFFRVAFLNKEALYRERVEEIHELYAGQLREKDRVITALAEQVEWLRAMVGRPQPVRAQPPVEMPDFMLDNSLHLSEEEEEIRHLAAQGVIEPEAAEAALQALGFANTKVEVEPE